MSQSAQATLEALRLAIHGVTAPFSCGGTSVSDGPVKILFKDGTAFEVVRAQDAFDQVNDIRPLLGQCKPAPFGEGKKTRYDRAVRDAMQLKAERGAFSVAGFDPESAGVLKEVQQQLLPHDPNPISAELDSLNVYTSGGHFAPHKDTPRGGDMVGTLVVCLPSQFLGGQLVLSHRGVVQKFDWGRGIQARKRPNHLPWAAFFGDVDHQIERVVVGARVTLTYLLRRRAGGAPPRDVEGGDPEPRVQAAWRALLADETFLPSGGTLGYPCCHLYHQDARFQQKQTPVTPDTVTMLKGRDRLVAASALQAGLKVGFHPYMFENCTDETWQLDRFPTRAEQARLRSQMDSSSLEATLPIRASSEQEGDFGVTWIESPPASDQPSRPSSRQSPPAGDAGPPAAAHLHSCEYCPWGYFGNEASEVDLYTYAALHIKIPPFGRGLRAPAKAPKRTPARRPRAPRKRKEDAQE